MSRFEDDDLDFSDEDEGVVDEHEPFNPYTDKPPSLRELVEYGMEVDHDGLPVMHASLRQKHNFVLQFFESGDWGTAYKIVFDATAGSKEARDKANLLIRSDQFIRDLLSVARSRVEENTAGLLAEHTAILAVLRDGAAADKKWASAVAAEVQRGKALGLYTVKAEGGLLDAQREGETMSEDFITEMLSKLRDLPENERKNIASLIAG